LGFSIKYLVMFYIGQPPPIFALTAAQTTG